MTVDEYRYRGFLIKLTKTNSWRVLVCDPFKAKTNNFEQYAASGFKTNRDAIKNAHKYINETIEKEMIEVKW